ncbi:hypothetical protein ACLBX9_04150 [Methylobacterium sp. A49B]|uniref:Uncharacterized protein n=1 Tax=Methylobacterium mesophilicum SR1.6/6 TaxID=908290 RepID=A0A6B9FLD4_9HYPH|nr:hypothetical protein [Methylobacterium mesophilicum]QGY01935.1 hypothetical protein MMSR116_08635 [Methylobacterium mesophilicum SR1.6/6]
MPTTDEPDDIRQTRKAFEPAVLPVLRRGREHRIVRWIGAGNRKLPTAGAKTASQAPERRVIKLGWSDTFGRPVRSDQAGFVRSGPAQVLPFRGRGDAAGQAAPSGAAGQPPVPVLR